MKSVIEFILAFLYFALVIVIGVLASLYFPIEGQGVSTMEQRKLKENPTYAIREDGKVINLKTNDEVKLSPDHYGRARVFIPHPTQKEVYITRYCTSLIFRYFKGIDVDRGRKITHKDGNLLNCSVDNLELTNARQVAHKFKQVVEHRAWLNGDDEIYM